MQDAATHLPKRLFPLLTLTEQALCGQRCNGELCRRGKESVRVQGSLLGVLASVSMEAGKSQRGPNANWRPRAASGVSPRKMGIIIFIAMVIIITITVIV